MEGDALMDGTFLSKPYHTDIVTTTAAILGLRIAGSVAKSGSDPGTISELKSYFYGGLGMTLLSAYVQETQNFSQLRIGPIILEDDY
jgi:hypothetical protein